MSLTQVTYKRQCANCKGSSGGRHVTFWRQPEELRRVDGRLLSEREIVEMLSEFLVDTTCPNSFCGEAGNWRVWEVEVDGDQVDYFPITTIEHPQIENLSKTGTKSLESVYYRRTCLACGQQREELDAFDPEGFYFNEPDELFGRRIINEIIRSLRTENVECEWCDLNGNWKITDLEILTRDLTPLN